jgi:hypothetical protein
MKLPNQDHLDFSKVFFSFREENGVLFHRSFVERSFFLPFGELLNVPTSESVKIVILGEDEPDPRKLNQIVSDRLRVLSQSFENALGLYIDVIGLDDFSERAEDYCRDVTVIDSMDSVSGRKLKPEDLLAMWEKRELHRIAELEEVTYVPSNGRLGFLFRIDWEVYLSDYGFSVLIEGNKVDYGIDQIYARFCSQDPASWFTSDTDAT